MTAKPDGTTCLVLFSGGLDSILACKVLQEQGIDVLALRFITPFFGYGLKGREEKAREAAMKKYGIPLEVIDVSGKYLEMLKAPPHGFGRYLNPCIDCKILMLRHARELMPRYGARFIATGEVLGQRPMSQRRDALRIIERDSGTAGLLLRPLCALRLEPTPMEEDGLVDRSRLLGIAGRGRKEQMALARRLGIEDYPTPAGGCTLADPILSRRFRRLMAHGKKEMAVHDFLLAQVGRQFLLPGGAWLVVGRKQGENERLERLARAGDLELRLERGPGPLGILRWQDGRQEVETAARILLRYSRRQEATVVASRRGGGDVTAFELSAASREEVERLRI